MNPLIRETIANVMYIPRKMKTHQNVSLNSLVENSGFLDLHEDVAEQGMREFIAQHPETIEEWECFSQDQCGSPAWFFAREKDGTFQLGWFSDTIGMSQLESYKSGAEACSKFVIRTLKKIRPQH
ncbi:MAG: hypothetical protein DHS20C16_32080 [Phycisphaerae bacterium]|nr:MAG: hypothetical protein DHS20C16_32080 [Phycisphaerae bacterium]